MPELPVDENSPVLQYMRAHKLEEVLQKAVNSMQADQPTNPFRALATYLEKHADVQPGGDAADVETTGDAAYAATQKFLAVGSCGSEGPVAYPEPEPCNNDYAPDATGLLTDTAPNLCQGSASTSLEPDDDDAAGPAAIIDHMGSPKPGEPPVKTVQEAVRRIKRAGGDMGIKKLVAQIKADFTDLADAGVKVGAKEVRLAVAALNDVGLDTPPAARAADDDDGEMKAGQANGYGTVAVDLAAEAEKAKATMKALRAAQMNKPPPVAMKKNPITGEMEKFESPALQDDLSDEDVDEDIDVGDMGCGADDY